MVGQAHVNAFLHKTVVLGVNYSQMISLAKTQHPYGYQLQLASLY